MRAQLLAAILALFISSCSVSVPYASDVPLSKEELHSPRGDFTGNVPGGWLLSSGDSTLPAITLFDTALTSAIVIRELLLDSISRQQVGKEGLGLLARIAAGLSGGHPAEDDLKKFDVRGVEFCAAEWNSANTHRRLVVFSSAAHHYACEARMVREPGAPDDFRKLCSVQQSLLASLKF